MNPSSAGIQKFQEMWIQHLPPQRISCTPERLCGYPTEFLSLSHRCPFGNRWIFLVDEIQPLVFFTKTTKKDTYASINNG